MFKVAPRGSFNWVLVIIKKSYGLSNSIVHRIKTEVVHNCPSQFRYFPEEQRNPVNMFEP